MFYGLFSHLLQPIVPHTFWARSALGYTKRLENCPESADDHSPSWRGCDQSKQFSSNLCCVIPFWERLLSSTLLSSHKTSRYAEDGILRSWKPLSWPRATIGAAWSNFSWEEFIFTSILKTVMRTLLELSVFASKSPIFSKNMFFGPPDNPSTVVWYLFCSLGSYHLQISVSVTQHCWLLRFYHKSHNILYFYLNLHWSQLITRKSHLIFYAVDT